MKAKVLLAGLLILHGLSILKIPRGLITNMNLRTLHQENIGIIKEQTIQINLYFTYTADNKKLKIDYKINSVSAELDENGNLKVISDDATIVFFIEQSGDNTISSYYQYSLAEGAKRYPYNAIKLK